MNIHFLICVWVKNTWNYASIFSHLWGFSWGEMEGNHHSTPFSEAFEYTEQHQILHNSTCDHSPLEILTISSYPQLFVPWNLNIPGLFPLMATLFNLKTLMRNSTSLLAILYSMHYQKIIKRHVERTPWSFMLSRK